MGRDSSLEPDQEPDQGGVDDSRYPKAPRASFSSCLYLVLLSNLSIL